MEDKITHFPGGRRGGQIRGPLPAFPEQIQNHGRPTDLEIRPEATLQSYRSAGSGQNCRFLSPFSSFKMKLKMGQTRL